jgi:peptidoglycan/LPS O-acetylase OafA/YrhL
VVLFHSAQLSGHTDDYPGRLLSHLDVGVTVFFLLTGFLLFRPFVAHNLVGIPRAPTALFYWRRLLRIAPAYWVAVLVLAPLVTYAAFGGVPNLAFAQIYAPDWSRTGIPPAWSVCVEASFYLLLPLYAAVGQRLWRGLDLERRRRNELAVLLILAVLSLLFRAVVQGVGLHPYAVDPLPGTFAWFAVGMALAVVSVAPGQISGRLIGAARTHGAWFWLSALVVYGALVALTSEGGSEGPGPLFVAYAVMALLVLLPAIFGAPDRVPARVLSMPPLPWLGLISYGIYLYHYPIMRELGSGSVLGLAAAGCAAAIACGAVSYYLVERNALRFKNVEFARRVPIIGRRLAQGAM